MSDQKAKLHLATSQQYLLENELSLFYLMLQIKQSKIELEGERLPLNVSFVLDRSGSMSGSKMAYTLEAVHFALSHLDQEDIVSVVAFDERIELPVPATKAENTDYLKQLLQGIDARGTTNLSGGLLEGAEQVKKGYSAERVNRVVLLTDGLANQGITDHGQLVSMVKSLSDAGISVSTLGVGEDFQEDLLVDMAEAGNGNFYFIASPDNIPDIFKEELHGLLSVTGQNPQVTIYPADNVQVRAVLGYEPSWGDSVTIRLPDLYNGDTKTVLAEMQALAGPAGMMPVAKVHFQYHDVANELARVSYDLDLSLEVTGNLEKLEKGADLKVNKEVAIFKAAQAREDAFKDADQGDFKTSRRKLDEQTENLRSLFEQSGDEELLYQLRELENDRLYMDEQEYTPMSRKEMKARSYQSRRKR